MRAPGPRLPRYTVGLLLAAGALLLFGPPLAAGTTSTWTNAAGDGEYATPGNWNPAGVPLDDGTKYYAVIPSGFSVSYDFPVPTVGTVTTLTLGANSTLTIDPGENLTVVGDAKISGNLQAVSGTFTATSAGCQFPGTAATLAATNGGQITFAAPAYSSTGLATVAATYNLLRADGIGSTLVLSAMTSMDMSFNDNWSGLTLQRISATNGGVINLSGVQTLKGAARAEDRVEFVIDSFGSNIDLSGLKTITAGSTKFDLSVPNFTLTRLESAVGTTFEVKAGTTLSLPALVTQTGNAVTVRSSGTVSAPELLTATGVTLTVETGGTFSAPKLTTFTGGVFARAPGQVLTLVPWTNIDNSMLSTSGGELLSIAAPGYSATGLNDVNVQRTLLSANGASGGGTPSQIAAPAMLTLNDGFDDGWNGTTVHRIAATNGGRINLSGLQTVTGPVRADDRLEFAIDAAPGSNIDLSGLKSTSGHTKFDLSVPAYTLPLLNAAVGTTFEVKAGTTLSLPALVTQNGDAVTVRSSGTVSAPELLTASGVTLTVETGGAFSAPKLTTFTGGVFARAPGQVLTLVPWTNIDNSILSTSGGELLTLAAPGYTTTALSQANVQRTLLSADGASGGGTPSQIAAPAMLTLNDGFDDGWGGATVHRINATNGGQLGLSGVETIRGPVRAEDRLEFNINTGGEVDLSSLRTTTGSQVQFNVASGGKLMLGSPTITDGARLIVDATTSLVHVAGDLTLSPTSRVVVTGAATVEVGGDFSFLYTDETAMNLDRAIFHIVGSGMEYLEVGSEDKGLPAGPASANFGLGQLVVGSDGAPTVVQLLEVVDNGNRTGGNPEALYLYGLGGPDGLRILGGSTFVIDNLNVYTTENNAWVHINKDLFGPGQVRIPYDQGFIELPEPATLGLMALGGLALLGRGRRVDPIARRRGTP